VTLKSIFNKALTYDIIDIFYLLNKHHKSVSLICTARELVKHILEFSYRIDLDQSQGENHTSSFFRNNS